MLKSLIQTIYPGGITCIACGRELDNVTRYGMCAECNPPRILSFCRVCGNELSGTKNYCDNCMNKDKAFNEARAPFCYDNEVVRKLVYGLKYGDKTFLAPYMAEFMADTFFSQNWQPDVLTYVPIHRRKKMLVRGYDQSELLAENVSLLTGVRLDTLLKKTVYTRKNAAKLGADDRRLLLENSFEVIGDVKGKNILLIDDVCTSGATTEECARVLKQARAKRVWVLTFAASREKPQLYSLDDADKMLNKFIKNKKLK